MKERQPEESIRETPDGVLCHDCGNPLRAIWQNVGFAAPDPEHWEIEGYEACDHKE